MTLRTIASIFLATLLINQVSLAQDSPIYLSNASFEDMPRPGTPPRDWFDCGFKGETPPDIQPDPTFSVSKPAVDGYSYLGMVVRDNDTWESVSQRLSRPLKKGQCYEFSIFLSRSELYISVSRISEEQANYTTPAKLRIYGGFGHCDKQYLMAETKVIETHQWREFKFKFEPVADYSYLIFEAFYNTPTLFPYNGNILIDNASAIVPVSCDKELSETSAPIEKEEVTEKAAPLPPPVTTTPPTPSPVPTEPPSEDFSDESEISERNPADDNIKISELKREDIRRGQIIKIDRLFFEADSSIIKTNSYEVLNEVYKFLDRNGDVEVEIGGHTNGLPPHEYCDNLSTERARAVAQYLVRKGIDPERLQYRGYGKRDPVASNKTTSGRKQNQRVEIKILSFDG